MSRILHVTEPTDAGTAVVVRELAQWGLDGGHTVTIASPQGQLTEWARAIGADWIELPLNRRPDVETLKSTVRLRALVKRHDVVHLHSSFAGAYGRVALLSVRRSLRPRSVFTPHAWSWYSAGSKAVAYRWVERALAPVTDSTVLVSRQELVDGQAVLSGRGRLVLVPNGVDPEAFSPEGPVSPRPDGALVVQVGRLSEQKGQDRAIRALKQLPQSVTLRFVGDGPLESSLRHLANELGLDARVEFVGHDDPRPHIRAADVVVQPSRWEGSSLALLEAMSLGAAIVGTRCGGSDLLENAGVLIENGPGVEAGLARAVEALLNDPEQRTRAGNAARERIVTQYNLASTLSRYESLWFGAPVV